MPARKEAALNQRLIESNPFRHYSNTLSEFTIK